jgi:hypothetical protein|tara:strand:- start:12388 stop:13764 length:1377 start_codon:yes stop_codon:yes gene_type:complete
MENNKKQKTVIEEAKADFQSIIDFAKQQVSVDLQEKVEDKIASLINEGSFSDPKLNETVTIDTDEATIVVSDNGDVDVEPKKNGEEIINGDENADLETKLEMDEFEISEEAEEYLIQDENMNLYNEEEPVAGALPIPEDPMAAPEMPAAEAPIPEMEAEKDLNSMSPEDLIKYAVEQIASQAVGGSVDGGEDEAVTVIDDEMPAEDPMAAPAPAPEPMAAPAPAPVAEEIDLDSLLEKDEDAMIEIEDVNHDMGELSSNDIVEIEIDEDDEPIDEMKAMGVSHSSQRTQGTSAGPAKAVADRSRYAQVNENKAREEANTAELNNDNNKLVNENASLRKEVTKLRESLPVLRKQIHEMKEFNAKVGFMLRLFEQGDFTKEERIQITEKFNQVDGYDNAKSLFREVMNEHSVTVSQKPKATKQGNTGKQIDRPAAQRETLFESAESSRMRELMTYGNKKR